jgi:hypothetical protein
MRKVLKFTLIAVLILLLTSWLTSIAYAHTNDNADQAIIRVEAAAFKAAPEATFFGNAIDGVTPGDLFYIDATQSPQDISVNLYITNSDELIHHLRYLILKVGVYFEDSDGQWRKALLTDGSVFPDTYITLQNSPVNLVLPGLARYKVTIDSGCFYCLPAASQGNNVSPGFYLDVEPA